MWHILHSLLVWLLFTVAIFCLARYLDTWPLCCLFVCLQKLNTAMPPCHPSSAAKRGKAWKGKAKARKTQVAGKGQKVYSIIFQLCNKGFIMFSVQVCPHWAQLNFNFTNRTYNFPFVVTKLYVSTFNIILFCIFLVLQLNILRVAVCHSLSLTSFLSVFSHTT